MAHVPNARFRTETLHVNKLQEKCHDLSCPHSFDPLQKLQDVRVHEIAESAAIEFMKVEELKMMKCMKCSKMMKQFTVLTVILLKAGNEIN